MNLTTDSTDIINWSATPTGLPPPVNDDALVFAPECEVRRKGPQPRFYDMTGEDAIRRAIRRLQSERTALEALGHTEAAAWISDALSGLQAELAIIITRYN